MVVGRCVHRLRSHMRAIILWNNYPEIARPSVARVKRAILDNRTAMRAIIKPFAALCIVIVMLASSARPPPAQDAPAAAVGEVAKPSVEELAIPAPKSGDLARESDTRE